MAIDRLFTFKDSETPNSYDPGDPDTYKQFIHAMITDSRDYENSVLAPKRDEAQKYYYGMLPNRAEPRLQRHADRRGPERHLRGNSRADRRPVEKLVRLDRRARRHPDDAAELGAHLRRERERRQPRPAHAAGRGDGRAGDQLRQLCFLAGQPGLPDPLRRVQGHAHRQDRLHQMVDRQHQEGEAQAVRQHHHGAAPDVDVRGPDRAGRARHAAAERHGRPRCHRRRNREQADHPRRGHAAGRDAPRPLRQDVRQVPPRRPRAHRLHR